MNYSNDISEGVGMPDWRLAICLGVAWVILFCTLVKGVQSSGKVRTGEIIYVGNYTVNNALFA